MDDDILNLALFQWDIVWRDPEANRAAVGRIMESYSGSGAPHPDIVVLPECFTTGFVTDIPQPEAAGSSPTLEWMISMARAWNSAVAGSIAVEDGGNIYNRFYFVTPSGPISVYDKKHLFRMGGEDRVYTPGNSRVVAVYKGWRILLNVCYDLRFPVWTRNRGGAEYDLILNVASWPAVRMDAALCLCRARAIENLSYFAFANRSGGSPGGEYSGGSAVWDFKGREISGTMRLGGAVAVSAALSMSSLRIFREKFPAWMDSDVK